MPTTTFNDVTFHLPSNVSSFSAPVIPRGVSFSSSNSFNVPINFSSFSYSQPNYTQSLAFRSQPQSFGYSSPYTSTNYFKSNDLARLPDYSSYGFDTGKVANLNLADDTYKVPDSFDIGESVKALNQSASSAPFNSSDIYSKRDTIRDYFSDPELDAFDRDRRQLYLDASRQGMKAAKLSNTIKTVQAGINAVGQVANIFKGDPNVRMAKIQAKTAQAALEAEERQEAKKRENERLQYWMQFLNNNGQTYANIING